MEGVAFFDPKMGPTNSLANRYPDIQLITISLVGSKPTNSS